jgi:hypothetical protein
LYSCIQERGENIPPEESFDVARRIKEMYCYTSSDVVKVFNDIECLVMLLGEHIYFDLEQYYLKKSKKYE